MTEEKVLNYAEKAGVFVLDMFNSVGIDTSAFHTVIDNLSGATGLATGSVIGLLVLISLIS